MDSKTYWAKRETEALKHHIADEEEYNRQINQIYRDMLESCQVQINDFYSRYAAKEKITVAEAKRRVSELDIKRYERKAARYVKERDFSDKANEEMRLYNATMKINRLEMLKANIGLELISGHNELDKFMSDILRGRTEEELKRQAGILGKTIRNNAQLAHSIPNASFHNATFSDRIWMYQDMMKADLGKLLQKGLIQGKNPRQLARELERYVMGDAKGGAKFNAERLMRTELARVQTEAQKQSLERNGFTQYIFIANGSCCSVCQGLNGKHFKVKDMLPGDNAPPMHPNCRCSTAAYEDREEYEAWLDFLDKGGTTAQWEALKTKQQAKGVLKNFRKHSTMNKNDSIHIDYTQMISSEDYKFTEKNIQKAWDDFKLQHSNSNVEYGAVITMNNKKVCLKGTEGSVDFEVGVSVDDLKNAVGFHNHPVGVSEDTYDSFSLGDLESIVRLNMGKQYLVSGNRTWSIEIDPSVTLNELRELYDEAKFEIYNYLFDNGEEMDFEQHRILEWISKKDKRFKYNEL